MLTREKQAGNSSAAENFIGSGEFEKGMGYFLKDFQNALNHVLSECTETETADKTAILAYDMYMAGLFRAMRMRNEQKI